MNPAKTVCQIVDGDKVGFVRLDGYEFGGGKPLRVKWSRVDLYDAATDFGILPPNLVAWFNAQKQFRLLPA